MTDTVMWFWTFVYKISKLWLGKRKTVRAPRPDVNCGSQYTGVRWLEEEAPQSHQYEEVSEHWPLWDRVPSLDFGSRCSHQTKCCLEPGWSCQWSLERKQAGDGRGPEGGPRGLMIQTANDAAHDGIRLEGTSIIKCVIIVSNYF